MSVPHNPDTCRICRENPRLRMPNTPALPDDMLLREAVAGFTSSLYMRVVRLARAVLRRLGPK